MKLKESKILDGKKVIIKTKPAEVNAWAKLDGKTIIVTGRIKTFLNPKEYNSVLLHEAGHLTPFNQILSILPFLISLSIALWFVLTFNQEIIFFLLKVPAIITFAILIGFFPVLILMGAILEALFCWPKEILADIHSLKRTEKGLLSSTLRKVYDYNDYIPFSIGKIYNKWILHPPMFIRLWFIKKFENKK
ncbi:protease HtpX [archaeon BMS3Abin17]|nr:protease HtpX [archaeon BMS3Abin17]